MTWQVLRSRVRRHAARKRRRAGRRGAARRHRAKVLFEGEAGRWAAEVRSRGRAARCRRSARGWWSTPPARARSRPRMGLLEHEPTHASRHRALLPLPRRAVRDPGIDEGATLVLNTGERAGLVLVHPAARRQGERRRGRSGRLPGEPDATATRGGLRRGGRARSGGARRASPAPPDCSRSGPPRLLLPLRPHRRRRLGAGRRRLRLPRPDLLARACCSPSSRARWLPTRSTTRLASGDLSGSGWGAHGPSSRAGMERCASWSTPSTRTASASPSSCSATREHRLDIVHLLVGNVFHDSGPMFERMSTMCRLPDYQPLAVERAAGVLPQAVLAAAVSAGEAVS